MGKVTLSLVLLSSCTPMKELFIEKNAPCGLVINYQGDIKKPIDYYGIQPGVSCDF